MNDAAKQIMYWRPFLAGGTLETKRLRTLGGPFETRNLTKYKNTCRLVTYLPTFASRCGGVKGRAARRSRSELLDELSTFGQKGLRSASWWRQRSVCVNEQLVVLLFACL